MAVGTGAGALNPTKPITVNDMMEAIALPGLKGGIVGDLADDDNANSANVCSLGQAGYTEVVDDIIVEVTETITGGTPTIDVGFTSDDGGTDDDDGPDPVTTHFLSAATIPLTKGTYSVLRGNFSWADTASHVNERTFGPGALAEPVGDAAGVAAPLREGAGTLTFICDNTAAGVARGKVRVYARTHYTAVNFGPGL